MKIHVLNNEIVKPLKLQHNVDNKIKYGKVSTYGEIAKKVGTSPRYVGNVCGQNKLLLIIPCHRVIRSDGKLGGFSGRGGIKLKKRLLNLEQSVS